MNYRYCFGSSLIALLVACQSHAPAGSQPSQIAYVDAAGNRMAVDLHAGAAKPDSTTNPVSSKSTVPLGAKNSPAGPSFGGEEYQDIDAVDSMLETRERERFYGVPDGSGRTRQVKAHDLGERLPPAAAPDWLVASVADCGRAVALPLQSLKPQTIRNLDFPVLANQQRYFGYLLPLSSTYQSLRIVSYRRKGREMPTLVAVVSSDAKVVAVVNNIQTETLPETMFRYGRVEGRVGIGPLTKDGGWLAILDARYAMKYLPVACRPGPDSLGGQAAEGVVTIEFSVSTE